MPTGISGTTESREHIFICRPELGRRRAPVRDANPVEPRAAARFGGRSTATISSRCSGSMPTGAAKAASRRASRRASWPSSRAPSSCYRAEPAQPPQDLAARRTVCRSAISSSRGGSSFFLWSEGPDDDAAELAEPRSARTNRHVLEQQVDRLLADPRSHSLVTNFAFQWLDVRTPRRDRPGPAPLPELRRRPARAFRDEMELLPRQHPARRSQRVDLLDGQAHVRQRAARPPLRHRERARRSVPPRRATGLEPLGPVRQRQRAHGHVVS